MIKSVSLPKNIKHIAFRAFAGCSIANLHIPSVDVFIGADAFCDTDNITVANAEHLPVGLIDAVRGTVFSDVRTIIKITQNGHSVYIPRFLNIDDIYSDDIITMDNILKFTQKNKMRIFDFLISENREHDFCNILSDMECNYEELMLILKILDAKHSNSVLMRAAVLDRVQKTEKKEKTKENLSV